MYIYSMYILAVLVHRCLSDLISQCSTTRHMSASGTHIGPVHDTCLSIGICRGHQLIG